MPTRDQTLGLLAAVIGEKYEVLQWIGGGGMANVFLARHRMTGGMFAVKVLADHLAGEPRIVERFLQEARTAAALSGHSNIVPIFDVGQEQGIHYIIMQYVEGEDLASYLQRQGRIAPVPAAQLLMQVSRALIWAHSKGVIHRDLKPSNIRLDRSGRAVVMDFGIAKASDVPTALTGAGERVGTPYYMSPEQIRGEPCDPRSDLYSLGVVFFQMLTGKRPFEGPTEHAIWHAHLYTTAPSPAEIDSGIPRAHCEVVQRLLDKDPARRYQTAAELLEDLKTLDPGSGTIPIEPLISEPISQAPPAQIPTMVTRAQPQPAVAAAADSRGQRSKLWLAAVAGGLLVAIVAAILLWPRQNPKPVEPPAPKEVTGPPASIQTPTGEMQLVPAGAFTFGDVAKESPRPPQTVFLPGFYVDRTEVSNAAYKQFCDATGHAPPEPPEFDGSYFTGKLNYPVVNISFEDAQAFASWAGKRLPSEEEWEKAARGPDGRAFPWGNSPPTRQANMAGAEDGFEMVAPVDAFPEGASPFGVSNMAGNVWEWTATAYPVTPREIADMETLVKSVGPTWNVIKGGNFTSEELWLRSYMRRGFPAASKSPFIGFRCVKDAK